jgi:hypothetical protein
MEDGLRVLVVLLVLGCGTVLMGGGFFYLLKAIPLFEDIFEPTIKKVMHIVYTIIQLIAFVLFLEVAPRELTPKKTEMTCVVNALIVFVSCYALIGITALLVYGIPRIKAKLQSCVDLKRVAWIKTRPEGISVKDYNRDFIWIYMQINVLKQCYCTAEPVDRQDYNKISKIIKFLEHTATEELKNESFRQSCDKYFAGDINDVNERLKAVAEIAIGKRGE